jgi:hypothetical protein
MKSSVQLRLDWSRGRLFAQRGLTTEFNSQAAAPLQRVLQFCCTVAAANGGNRVNGYWTGPLPFEQS